MKKQEKINSIKRDLCPRIPYGVKVRYKNEVYDMVGVTNDKAIIVKPLMSELKGVELTEIKPYLRPIGTITYTEKEWLRRHLWFGYPSDDYDKHSHRGIEIKECFLDNEEHAEYDFQGFYEVESWLNEHHIDYRGMIDKKLAVRANDEIYGINRITKETEENEKD